MKLESLSDIELITRVKNDNCSDSLIELQKRHKGIICKMAHKYGTLSANQTCSGVATQDFLDNQLSILYEAVKKFDESYATKFVTFLGNSARYSCLNTVKQETKYYNASEEREADIKDELYSPDTQNFVKLETEYIFEILEKMKDPRIKRIIEMRYFGENRRERSFANIANELGISTQWALDLHNNFIAFIKDKIKSKERMDEI